MIVLLESIDLFLAVFLFLKAAPSAAYAKQLEYC